MRWSRFARAGVGGEASPSVEQSGPSDVAGLSWPLIGLVAVGLCTMPLLILGDSVDRWTDDILSSMTRPAGVFTVVVVLLTFDTALPVPSSILATIAGHRLGFVVATVAIAAGLWLGNVVGYLIGRLAGSAVVERLAGRAQLERARFFATTRPGAAALAITRPVPILSEATMLLAGAARTPFARTLGVCALADVGVALAYAGMGSAAEGATALPLFMASSVGLPAAAFVSTAVGARRRHHGSFQRCSNATEMRSNEP